MLRQRSISAVGVVLVTAIPALLGGPLFAAAMAALALFGAHELLRALDGRVDRATEALVYLAALGLIVAVALDGSGPALAAIIVLFVIASLVAGVLRAAVETGLASWSAGVLTVVYLGLPLAYAVALRDLQGAAERGWVNRVSDPLAAGAGAGLAWVAMVFAVTWLTDTAAYLVGRGFGRAKLVPALSPGKTRVGALAGIVAGTLSAPLAAWIFGAPLGLPLAAGLGLVLSLAGQLGDLGESLIKRNLGIKDMGALIPGHGGVLDRIDALLFTFPLMFLLVRLVEWLGWT
ncbi:MAG TPA: phosphatidate cytidylyltransferase [Thermomicrobiaceae bacterium]|nr:phosphatidate cytidylyltransferase [Thermomicrobiaceae bacterium]